MNIINIKTYRIFKERVKAEQAYRVRLLTMEKADLLQELLNYHESYQKDPHDLNVTLRAQHLLEILEQRAELRELQELAKEFQTKLRVRLYQQIQNLGV